MQKRVGLFAGGGALCVVLLWVLFRAPSQSLGNVCGMGEENPFAPNSLDIVVNYVNFTKPTLTRQSQAVQCGVCGSLECDPSSDAPCCQNWFLPDKKPGTCGSGPSFCDCPNCLDSRVVGSDRSYSEIRWLLRGIDHNIGVWSQATPFNIVRNIYIIYNSMEGNGPPRFIEWEPCSFRNALRHAECNETVYVSARYPALVAVPQCFYFPLGSPPHGQSRDASQIGVHRIANLSKWFLYMEDDVIPSSAFRASDFVDMSTKRMRSYADSFYLFEYFQPGNWAKSKIYSLKLVAERFGWRPRFAEGSHMPFIVSRCVMEEVEATWKKEFIFTINDAEGPDHLQFATLASAYAVANGLTVNHLLSSHVSYQVHLDLEGKVGDPRALFCDWNEHPTPFLQLQGPSWSDEMTMCGPPRADWRLVLDSFMHHILPMPSRFETPNEARAFNSLPRANLQWPCAQRATNYYRVLLVLFFFGFSAWFSWQGYQRLRLPSARPRTD